MHSTRDYSNACKDKTLDESRYDSPEPEVLYVGNTSAYSIAGLMGVRVLIRFSILQSVLPFLNVDSS
jgi:hypothetical protein